VSDKPSYLGLLNAIANGEARGHKLLSAWAEATPDDDVRQVLKTVAIREGEHALAFEKRMCELGFGLLDRPDPDFKKRLDVVCSGKSDLEKFEALGYGRRGANDVTRDLAKVFDDETIDAQTGALLGRFVAEERDSGRRLNACHEALRARAPERRRASASGAGGGGEQHVVEQRIAEITRMLSDLRRDIESLRG